MQRSNPNEQSRSSGAEFNKLDKTRLSLRRHEPESGGGGSGAGRAKERDRALGKKREKKKSS